MILGIGVDIQEINQIKEIYSRKKERFFEKVFTHSEIEYCEKHKDSFKHYAARWAIKEAFLKAIGTGITGGYTLKEIETVNLPSGKPIVNVYGKLSEDINKLNVSSHISISHSGEYAVGQVLLYQPSQL